MDRHRHAVIGKPHLPAQAVVGLDDQVVAQLLGLPQRDPHVLLDAPQKRVLAEYLPVGNVVLDPGRLEEDHGPLGPEIVYRPPQPFALGHYRHGRKFVPFCRQLPNDLAILETDHDSSPRG